VPVDARLTVLPRNTTASVGSKAVLRCSTDRTGSPTPIYWVRQAATALDIVTRCTVITGFTAQYGVINNQTGRCDLVVSSAALDSAGMYSCTDGIDLYNVYLTVTGESVNTLLLLW